MKFLFLLIGIFSLFDLSAQKKRKILDKNTGLPVSYATIRVLNSAKGTIASVSGEFIIDVNPGDTLLISCAGYTNTSLLVRDAKNIVYMEPSIVEFKSVFIGNEKPLSKIIIGNEKKIVKGDLTWGPYTWKIDSISEYGEFAQKMFLADSAFHYKIKKIFIPVKKLGKCFGPLLLRIYQVDTINNQPGTEILNRLIANEDLLIKKNLLTVDVSTYNLFFNGLDSFFVGITWPLEAYSNPCKTGLPLSKNSVSQTYTRTSTANSFQWFPFGRMKDLNGTEFVVKTFFSVEVEIFKNYKTDPAVIYPK